MKGESVSNYKILIFSGFLLITYIILLGYLKMDVSDILSELDFKIIFSDLLSDLSFRSICILRFVLYLTLLTTGLILIKKILSENKIYAGCILILAVFCILDLWIISSLQLFYSLINNGNEIIMKDISAFSYYNPGNEFEFYYDSNRSIVWKGNIYTYYVLISFIRVMFIGWVFRKIIRSEKLSKEIYINTFFTFFFIGIIINLNKGTEFVVWPGFIKFTFFLFVFLIVSVYEEYIFRYIVINNIFGKKSLSAILTSSMLFTFSHFNYYSYIDVTRTFILGVAFAVIYVRYNLRTVITAHFSYNIAVYIMNLSFF